MGFNSVTGRQALSRRGALVTNRIMKELGYPNLQTAWRVHHLNAARRRLERLRAEVEAIEIELAQTDG